MKRICYSLAIPITLLHSELSVLYSYLYECHIKAFIASYDFNGHTKVREYLYHWHLMALIHKAHTKLAGFGRKKPSRRISLRLNEPEVIVFKVCFQRVDSLVFDTELELLILKQLKNEKII